MDYMNVRRWKIGLGVVLAVGLPFGAAAMQWPDTAQDTCYNNDNPIPCPAEKTADFHGQDAQFQGPTRSYTKLGHGGVELDENATDWIMVRDNVTGLVWEVKNNKDGTADHTNPHDADNEYSWCDSTAIPSGYCPAAYDTEQFILSLNDANFGGFSDWRMPTIQELSTLLYIGIPPLVDWNYFPETKGSPGYYWSSSEVMQDKQDVWELSFYSGESRLYPKGCCGDDYVRAVRGGL